MDIKDLIEKLFGYAYLAFLVWGVFAFGWNDIMTNCAGYLCTGS